MAEQTTDDAVDVGRLVNDIGRVEAACANLTAERYRTADGLRMRPAWRELPPDGVDVLVVTSSGSQHVARFRSATTGRPSRWHSNPLSSPGIGGCVEAWRPLAGEAETSAATPSPLARITPTVDRILANADREAAALHHNYVGTEHLLLAILREPSSVAGHVLTKTVGSADATRRAVMELLDEPSPSVDGEPEVQS